LPFVFRGETYFIEIGGSTKPMKLVLQRFLISILIGLPVVAAIGWIGGYFLVRRALNPIRRIITSAKDISLYHLNHRLPVTKTGDEIEALSVTLNQMISKLETSFQSVSRFTTDASHELRTPLTILRGELEALLRDESHSDQVRETINSLLEETERLVMIVQGLLALTRLDRGDVSSDFHRLDLAELAKSTTEQISLLANEKAIVLETHCESPVLIEGSESRLKQVIVNLLDNAIKYTPDSGRIGISVTQDGDTAILEISDNGRGILETELELVFERFYRSTNVENTPIAGSGLGLSIVKSICNAHAATVSVRNRHGGGAVFTVKIPLVS
jgi:signal transduction histidine kinase